MPVNDSTWYHSLTEAENRCERIIGTSEVVLNQELSETGICWQLARLLPDHSNCFVGNSMPVRLLDLLAGPKKIRWFSQRGASGIDGVLAHATGVARASGVATTLIMGDLSFLHDINSLALSGPERKVPSNTLLDNQPPLVVIVINNNGGNIFRFLPVPEEARRELFQTPHHLSFGLICRGFGVRYFAPESLPEFVSLYSATIQKPGITVIEIAVAENSVYYELKELRKSIQQSDQGD